MKKTLTLLTTLLAAYATFSQSILIKDPLNNDITNTTYTFTGTPGEQKIQLSVELAAGVTTNKDVAMKRYETAVCPGTSNFFCWTLCYGELNAGIKPIWEDGPVNIAPGTPYGDFQVYYNHNGVGADGTFLYVLYDTANVSDSSWILVKFDYNNPNCNIAGDLDSNGVIDNGEIAGDVNGNGMIDNGEIIGDANGNGVIDGNEIAGDANGNYVIDNGEIDYTGTSKFKKVDITVFPNPAHNFFVVSNTQANDKVELIDILGKEVYSNTKASAIHQLSEIKKGLYFVRIVRENEVIYTEKLLVK